ncbi:protein mono-ADP-ribosyltransferase PARP15-like isoform 2-T2 [Salvelinus alpinus]|uniref:protein mono-ADP-ribosyltransferase PARP15-like n=1 Tax=Salvelinus alpinus TaxID=8036 RepID=UPI0039FD2243
MIGRLLERFQSVRVENLTSNIPEDMLELYFEKWAGPAKDITVFHEEQAAIVTFHAPEDNTSVSLPALWDEMKCSLLMLVPLTPGSKGYNDVEKKFRKTLLRIERVQNDSLWKSYQIRKNLLEEKNKHTNNEKLLFHGTSSNSITQINSHGFNRSYAGTHGAAIGNGSYFAVDSSYSANVYSKADAQGIKCMYLARVLVGDYTRGQEGLIVPPAKPSGKDDDLYDSVTDNTSNPTMFVIFSDVQAYPEYLITF